MLRLLPQLPWDSKYKLALADDERLVEATASEEEERGARRAPPPLSEWSQLQDLRAALLDGIAGLERTIIAVNTPKGKKVPDVKAQPRPETAAMRIERRRKDRAMSELETKLGMC